MKNLKIDPLWEPDDEASEEEWELFDEVYEEFEADQNKQDEPKKKDPEDEEDDDDDEDDDDYGSYYFDEDE